MKERSKFNSPMLKLLIVVFVVIGSTKIVAQENKSTDLKHFKIVLEKTENGIKMKSDQGAAWIDWSFNLDKDKPQAINAYGMTDLNNVNTSEDANFADFLFTITKTDNGFKLKGIKGTSWTDLSFSLKDSGAQAIDQDGMTTKI